MSELRIQTKAVHAGESVDPVTKASSPNIVMSNSFVLDAPKGFSIQSFNEESANVYTRWSNPTIRMLEEKLASLENADDCVCFASGMAATSAVLNSVLEPSDHFIACDIHYPGSAELIRNLCKRLSLDCSIVDTSEVSLVEEAVVPGRTKLIWLETPANPILKITDLQSISTLAKNHGICVAVDSTLATPIATRPTELGVDLVVHSLSKYIGGHGDALGGAVIGNESLIEKIRTNERVHVGGILSPFNAWLIARGASTLPVRMKCHSDNAMALARYLEQHPRVTRVLYPGLPEHPQHELATKQMECFAGVLSFSVRDGKEFAAHMASELTIIHYAVSLGSHRSLMYWIDTEEMLSTSYLLTDELANRYRSVAGEGIFRFAVGLEDPADLCEELSRVLN